MVHTWANDTSHISIMWLYRNKELLEFIFCEVDKKPIPTLYFLNVVIEH
jgi:hypothetical protein